jgi:predicted nucleic acid-binding protein
VARLNALKEEGLGLSVVSLADFDLLIGATALQHDLTLLTNSRRHFELVEGCDWSPNLSRRRPLS